MIQRRDALLQLLLCGHALLLALPFKELPDFTIFAGHLTHPFTDRASGDHCHLSLTPHIIAYFSLLAQVGILPLVLLVENAPSASSTNVYRRKIFSSRVRPSIVGRKRSSKSRSFQPRARAYHIPIISLEISNGI